MISEISLLRRGVSSPALLRYGFAVLAVLLALLIRWPLQPVLQKSVPFLFFFPAVMAAGWLGRLGPGLLATALSAVAADLLFHEPAGSFAVTEFPDQVQLALFCSTGVFISLLNETLHRERNRLEEVAVQLLRAREEAKESEERFRITADSAPVLIWMAGTDKLCDWFNKPWLEFTGRTLEQETGNGWTEGVHPDDFDFCIETYTTAFDARQPFSMEYRLRRHDGEHRWLLDNGVPRYAADGTFQGYIGSCIDIHHRKRAEEERTALLFAAEEANRTKDDFLATVSHELRTPLNAMMGWAQILLVNDADPERREKGLRTIVRNGRLQAQLIDDLLDVSRIVTGKMRLDVRPVELVAVIEAAVESIRPAADAKTIGVRTLLDPLAGPVAGDPARLQQVVWNLLANAVKFTPKGGKVEVRLERVNSHVEIIVADNGIGIGPAFLPHVFDRFRQLDNSIKRQYGGLGLGLSIVRHLTELHGGTVRVKSPGEGQGSTFIVMLPVSVAHFDPAKGEERIHPAASDPDDPCKDNPALNLKGVRVLAVEDEPDARETLRHVLEQCNAEVRTVASVAEAMAELAQWKPHVLLSDIGLPGEDGYSLIRKIRSLPPEEGGKIPAAALTAFARSEDRRRALMAGFQLHLAKPVDIHELAAVVATLARG